MRPLALEPQNWLLSRHLKPFQGQSASIVHCPTRIMTWQPNDVHLVPGYCASHSFCEQTPVLNVNDFACFLHLFAAGCR